MAQKNNYSHLQQEVIDLRDIILADNKSIVDIFGNEKSLRNIWSENGNITTTTSARNFIQKYWGITGYPHLVWYHPKSINNIMKYSHIYDLYQITYDNHKEDKCLLKKNENDIIKFVRSRCGMC